MSRRSRGGGDEGEGGASEAWMTTYSDLVTLLFAFFVLLFAFSTVDAEKWEALVSSFTGISIAQISPIGPQQVQASPIGDPFGGLGGAWDAEEGDGDSDDGDDPAAVNSRLWQLYNHMVAFMENEKLDGKVYLIEEDHMIRLVLSDMIFFRTAEATVLPEAYPIIDKVINMFAEVSDLYRMLSVEGHTDNRPINTTRYPSNWELSSDRALNVGSYIRGTGLLDEDRLQVVGFGDRHPIMPNDSPENMSLNRRVEFVAETKTPPSRGRNPATPNMRVMLIETADE